MPKQQVKSVIWHPPSYTEEKRVRVSNTYTVDDIRAIQALERGDASPELQKLALNWLIYGACQLNEDPFYPGQDGVRDYVLGRQSVAKAIQKLLKLKPEMFK